MEADRSMDELVDGLIRSGIDDKKVLSAMKRVPRHEFVDADTLSAYSDKPLPIGYGQTISQPYIVALMTSALDPKPSDKILEVGTGSGYQAAVLSLLVREVYSVEVIGSLAKKAKDKLKQLGFSNVKVKHGNGAEGWPGLSPFDSIILTAAPEKIPEELFRQLKMGGELIAPVGDDILSQRLIKFKKTEEGISEQFIADVRFVKMVT